MHNFFSSVKNVTIFSYGLKLIDSTGFMTSSLSNLVNNHPGGIHKACM